MVKCNSKLVDVIDADEISQVIRNYHESKTNHRGIDETEERIKKIIIGLINAVQFKHL